jgi:hypothetical protein
MTEKSGPDPMVEEVGPQVLQDRGNRRDGERPAVPRAGSMAAPIVGEVGQPADVVEVGVGQEDVLDAELLRQVQRRGDRPRLEEDHAVQQDAGEVPRRRRAALTAEHFEMHGGTIAGKGVKGR